MRTRNANNGNISSIINLVDADLGCEDVDEVRTTAMWDFELRLNDDEAVKLHEVYKAWQSQHKRWYADAYVFLVASRDFDQHKWLLNKIAS